MVFSVPYTAHAANGRRLADFASKYGIDIGPLAKAVGIDVAVFQSDSQRVSLEAFAALLDILATVSADDCFGLHYAETFQLGDVGPFGFAVMNAPTVRKALEAYKRFQVLVSDVGFFDVELDEPFSVIEWRYAGIITKPEHYGDFRAALCCKLMRRLAGQDWYPSAVELVRTAPRSLALHQQIFGPALRFGVLMNRIRFASSILDLPVRGADERLYTIMTGVCERDLEMLMHRKDLRVVVKQRILSILPLREVTLQRVAAALGVGDRTLQRRLGDYGTSFEKLVEDTRHELSDRLLTGGDTPLAEISYLCGYSSPSAYSRAARSWYGVPPAEYRKQHRLAPT